MTRIPRLLPIAAAILLAACSAGGPSASPASSPSLAGSASAPADSPGPSAAAFPITLTDDEGQELVLEQVPQRIVSLTPAATETLFALGAGPRIVGNDDYDDYPADATTITHVASYTGVDVEKLVSLEPDLVVAGGGGFTDPDAVARIRTLGIPVLVLYATEPQEVFDGIRLLGRATGTGERAEGIATAMQLGMEAIAAAVGTLDAPRVFYEIDATKEIYGPADDSFVAAMVRIAGGEPITTGSTTVYSIPLEKLVAADPEVIVLGEAAYGTTVESVLARSGWSTMTAVTTQAIRPVDDTIVTRPGPRLISGLRALALAIHPGAILPPAPEIPAIPAD